MNERLLAHNRSTAHVFRALRVIADSPEPLSTAEVAAALGLPSSTAYRALAALEDAGLLRRSNWQPLKYELGVVVDELLDAVFSRYALRDVSAAQLERLAAATGETVSLVVPVGWYIARISGVEGWKPMRLLHLGGVGPMHRSAHGRAVMLTMNDDEIEHYLATRELVASTPRTPADAPSIRKSLEKGRRNGYVIDIGGTVPNISAIAFPVRGPAGAAIAAVGIDGPSVQFEPEAAAEGTIHGWARVVRELEQIVAADPKRFEDPFAHIARDDLDPLNPRGA